MRAKQAVFIICIVFMTLFFSTYFLSQRTSLEYRGITFYDYWENGTIVGGWSGHQFYITSYENMTLSFYIDGDIVTYQGNEMSNCSFVKNKTTVFGIDQLPLRNDPNQSHTLTIECVTDDDDFIVTYVLIVVDDFSVSTTSKSSWSHIIMINMDAFVKGIVIGTFGVTFVGIVILLSNVFIYEFEDMTEILTNEN